MSAARPEAGARRICILRRGAAYRPEPQDFSDFSEEAAEVATSREFLNHVLDCCAGLDVRARAMMGEYVLYYREKVAGVVCDNCVFLKDVPAARALLPGAEMMPPYEGARPMLPLADLENRAKIEALLEKMYPELPAPRPRRRAATARGAGAPEAGAVERIRARLFALADSGYRDFSAALVPTLPREKVIGVRAPLLRALARELRGSPDAAAFLEALPHEYLEENHLHGFLIEDISDYDACVAALDRFLPFVDNWATCDMTSPRALGKNLPALRLQAEVWMDSEQPYAVRFGIGALMRHFLGEHFDPSCLERVSRVRSEHYYVRMMVAWFFAEALARNYEAALAYIEGRSLDAWTHNKAIQKALESRKISPERKRALREMKISGRKSS